MAAVPPLQPDDGPVATAELAPSRLASDPSASDTSASDISGSDISLGNHPYSRTHSLTIVAGAAVILSIASLLYFYANGMTNVYGDGVAHLNIARKVVDSPDASLWRRYMQIGSPWLPLQTVLMLPLVWNDWLWRTGLAGSFVSMVCFIITALSVYLIAESIYQDAVGYRHHRALPFLAAAVFILNPGVLYMQATPMTEMVFMAALAVAVLMLQRWALQQTTRRLLTAAATMSMATLSRYEAWPVAVAAVALVLVLSKGTPWQRMVRSGVFAAIAEIGPVYWLWHNWAIYGNAIEFLTGPNSARGIYLKNAGNLGWSKIFVGHVFLDVALMAVDVAVCAGPLLAIAGLVGIAAILLRRRAFGLRAAPAFLLTIPFAFEVFSLFRGEIQVFPLSAFGLLNVRYGLPVLLPIAIFLPAVLVLFNRSAGWVPFAAAAALVLVQYGLLISDGPSQMALYQEGLRNGVNSQAARQLTHAADYLASHPPTGMVLMETGSLGPLVSKGGLKFSRVVHEGTARWYSITDSVPDDIQTIIVQSNDVVDQKIKDNAKLAHDVDEHFDEQYRSGNIRVLRRH